MDVTATQLEGVDMNRSCLAKKRYWSRVDALVMAAIREAEQEVPALGTYHCRNCAGWHLTSQI